MSTPTHQETVWSDKSLEGGPDLIYTALTAFPEAARAEARHEAHAVLDDDAELKKRVKPLVDDLFRRIYRPKLILSMGLLMMIFLGIGFYVTDALNAANSKINSQGIALARSEAEIAAFRQQLDASNTKLVSQGLAPVSAPAVVTPGSPQQAELINAAATASTLARLPESVITQPDTQTIANAAAKAVSDYFATNPAQPGLTPQNVIDMIAAYLAAHPLPTPEPGPAGPSGPQGPQGDPGPPPTAQQITDAFTAAVQNNPQLLCVSGGSYGSRTLVLADGGTTTSYGCFVDNAPAPTTDPAPAPTTDPVPGG